MDNFKSLDLALAEIDRLRVEKAALLEALERASDSVDEDYFLKPAILAQIRAAIRAAKGDMT